MSFQKSYPNTPPVRYWLKKKLIDPPQIHIIGPANVAVKLSASVGYCGQFKMTTVSVKKKLHIEFSGIFVLIVCKLGFHLNLKFKLLIHTVGSKTTGGIVSIQHFLIAYS